MTGRWLPLLLLAVSGTPHATADDDHERARRLREAGEILPLERLLERAREQAGPAGHLLEVELERERGRWVYELEVLGDDGVVRELLFDAADGRYLGEEE